MNLLESLASGGVGALLNGIGTLAKNIRIAITGKDPEKLAEIEAKLIELEFAAQKAQTEITLQEAKHPSVFVAGWRPFIGWVCGLGIAYHFIGHPLLLWLFAILDQKISPPALETEGLLSLVMALLGIGGLRTFEKIKGVQNRH